LAQGERTVEDLANEANLPIANASQHLQVLRAAQLVDVRRDGLYAYYRLSDERVFRVWQTLRDLGELQLAEVNRLVQSFLQDRSPLKSITTSELLERMEAGDVLILDVRPELEYQSGHIPEARSSLLWNLFLACISMVLQIPSVWKIVSQLSPSA